MLRSFLIYFLVLLGSFSLSHASEEEARKYFVQRSGASDSSTSSGANYSSGAVPGRYMKIFIGFHYDNKAFSWGQESSEKNVSNFQAGVAYRFGEWIEAMDMMWQFDFTSYTVKKGDAVKFAVMPVISFPDVNSGFPIYFGIGAGPGIFLKQVADESLLSLDYKIFAGFRLLNVVGSTGFYLETGLRNQVFLLSQGQHNALFVNIGSNFNF